MELSQMKKEVERLSQEYFAEIVSFRRHLHQHPELSKKEAGTASFIKELLDSWDVPCRDNIGGHGIIAELAFRDPGSRVIALRADMDALPIHEQNDVPYKSLNTGVMHACGHDVHMASLLGVIKILKALGDRLQGTVRFLFQPSEEEYPGGALGLIKAGALENPVPDLVIGQHVYPELEVGKAGLRAGFYMASTDEIFITVKGKGGHAAIPDKLIDPVLIASHIVVALQQIVSRNASPTTPTVISFGRIIGEGRTNIIPDEVRLEGIMRTFDEKWREEIKQRVTSMATSIAEGMGAKCEVFIDKGYPAVYNSPEETERIRRHAQEYLGDDRVVELDQRMTAEDFSYYQQKVPGVFYRLGVMNREKGITSNLHSSTFDVDEKALQTGMGTMAWITIMELMTH